MSVAAGQVAARGGVNSLEGWHGLPEVEGGAPSRGGVVAGLGLRAEKARKEDRRFTAGGCGVGEE